MHPSGVVNRLVPFELLDQEREADPTEYLVLLIARPHLPRANIAVSFAATYRSEMSLAKAMVVADPSAGAEFSFQGSANMFR